MTVVDEAAEVVMFEPPEMVKTGDVPVSDFTAPQGLTV
jgi:hypothetical protein